MAEKKGYSRRDFLKIVGAGSALAASGCAEELPEKLVPYVVQPEDVIPGVSAWYTSTCRECASGCGTVVRTREGRALIVEGNKNNPISEGGVCAAGQASVQVLYDPDRVREPVLREGDKSFASVDWEKIDESISTRLSAIGDDSSLIVVGEGISGVEGELVKALGSRYKKFHYVDIKPSGCDSFDSAVKDAFGSFAEADYELKGCDVILSVSSDFLESWGNVPKQSRGWASGRGEVKHPNTMIYTGPRLSATAASSDLRVITRPGSEKSLLLLLLGEVAKSGRKPSQVSSSVQKKAAELISKIDKKTLLSEVGISETELQKIAKALLKSKSPAVVTGGPLVSGATGSDAAYLSFLLNGWLGALGKSVIIRQLPESKPREHSLSFSDFVSKLEDPKEKIGAVIFLDSNPLYRFGGTSRLKTALARVKTIITLGFHIDETAQFSTHVLPLSHDLECWADSETRPGIHMIVQPAMQPLYKTRSIGEFLYGVLLAVDSKFAADNPDSFFEYFQKRWKKILGSSDFEGAWNDLLQKGFVDNSWTNGVAQRVSSWRKFASAKVEKALGVVAFSTGLKQDGKRANCAWLQEVPDTMTTSVWSSWVELHPSTASKSSIKKGDLVQVTTGKGSINAPVYISENIHPDCVGVPLGFGHSSLGRYADGIGARAMDLFDISDSAGLEHYHLKVNALAKNPWEGTFTVTQGSDSQLERHLLQTTTLSALGGGHGKKSRDDHGESHGDDSHGDGHGGGHHAFGHFVDGKRVDMYEQMPHVQYHWGMNVDLSKCTGCSACVVACYAENNVPVVGKDLCAEGREMSWIKIDRYFNDDKNNPVEGFQPLFCQHCANAPCEPVCPVYATYHNDEGMNVMVYNRCVGTRYCANNCSYKVRRFNWFRYWWPEPLTWQLNPDVSVREVGVMEKCSFCVQRVRDAKNKAKNEGRAVADMEVQPACAASCPTDCFTFGNMADENSSVSHKNHSKLAYRMLDDHLNTQPAVSYLKRVKNDSLV